MSLLPRTEPPRPAPPRPAPIWPLTLARSLCLAIGLWIVLGQGALLAAPKSYSLQPDGTIVGFSTDFGQDRITGHIPIASANLKLDFDQPGQSTIDVTLNVARADASFPFAAQALKGPKVLAASTYPHITFTSTRIRAEGDGARVDGIITIRGVARPIAMFAQFYQQPGQAKGDLALLTIHLTGALKRSDFGAVGWNDMVGDEVRLDIRAKIARDE